MRRISPLSNFPHSGPHTHKPSPRRTVTRFLLAIFFVFSLSARVAPTHAAPSTTDPTVLGALLPLSGDYAQYGRELQRGIELASIELSQAGRPLHVHYEDGGTMVAGASLAAATKLVHSDGAKLLLVLGADDVPPLLGLAQSTGAPILSLWDSSKILFEMGPLVFSNGFSVEATGPKLANHLVLNEHRTRLAIISNTTTWSTTITSIFVRQAQANGAAIVFSESVADDWTDYRSIIVRMMATKPDAIFLPFSLPSALIACIRQLRELGVRVPLATGEALVGEAMKQLGTAAEGVIVGWPPSGDGAALRQQYIAKFNEPPWNPSIFRIGYDGIKAVASAIAQSPKADLRLALSNYFGETRSANREYAVFRVTGGQLVEVSQVRTTTPPDSRTAAELR